MSRLTRSSVKALSVSPTDRTESPVPRTRSADVTTPLKSTPAKIRTRRASLADTPQDVVASPIRRSRRLSTNSEEVLTPTKTRSLRSARVNLTLLEQPVPEEDEQTKVSPKPLRGKRKSLATNLAEGQSQTSSQEKDGGPRELKKEATNEGKTSRTDKSVLESPKSDADSPVVKKSLVKLKRFSSEKRRVSQSPPSVKQQATETRNALLTDSSDKKPAKALPSDLSDEKDHTKVLSSDSADSKNHAKERTDARNHAKEKIDDGNFTVEEKMEIDLPTVEKQVEARDHQITTEEVAQETPESNTQSPEYVPEAPAANVHSLNVPSNEEMEHVKSEPLIEDANEKNSTEVVEDDEEECSSKNLGEVSNKSQLNNSTFTTEETAFKSKELTTSTSDRQSPPPRPVAESEDKTTSSEANKITFAKSWSQSVKGSVNRSSDEPEFIDAISVKPVSAEKRSPRETEEPIAMKKKAKYQESSEEEYEEEDEEEDEEEREADWIRNEFLDSEAIEVSEGEDSMSSGERAYLEENEISVKGESIGSDDSSEDEVENEEDEKGSIASFILSDSEVSDGEMLSGRDSLLGSDTEISTKKKYRRVIINEDSSSEGESNHASKVVEEVVESSDLENVAPVEVCNEIVGNENTPNSEGNNERKKSEPLDTSKTSRNSIGVNKKGDASNDSEGSNRVKEENATLANNEPAEAEELASDVNMGPSEDSGTKGTAIKIEEEANLSNQRRLFSLGTSFPQKDADDPNEEVAENTRNSESGLADSGLNTSTRKKIEQSVVAENCLEEENEDEYDKLVSSGRESMSSAKSQSQLLDVSNLGSNSPKITATESGNSQMCNASSVAAIEDVNEDSPASNHSVDDSCSESDGDEKIQNGEVNENLSKSRHSLTKSESRIKNESLIMRNTSRSIREAGHNDSKKSSKISMNASKVSIGSSPKIRLCMEDESESDNELRGKEAESNERMDRSSASVKNTPRLSNNLNKSNTRRNQISSRDEPKSDEEPSGNERDSGGLPENAPGKNRSISSKTNRNWDKLNSSDQLEACDEFDDAATNSSTESKQNSICSKTRSKMTSEIVVDSGINTTILQRSHCVNGNPPKVDSQQANNEDGSSEEEPDEQLNKSSEDDNKDLSAHQKLGTKEITCQEADQNKAELEATSESDLANEEEDEVEIEKGVQRNGSRINSSKNARVVSNVTTGPKMTQDGPESDKHDDTNLHRVNKSPRLSLNSSKRRRSSVLQKSNNQPESSDESDAEEVNNISTSSKITIPLFQTLKMVDQSTPTDKYKIKLKINDKTYISSDGESDVSTDKAQTIHGDNANLSRKSTVDDTSFTISRTGETSCAKNVSIDLNKSSNKKMRKSSKQQSPDKSLEKSPKENNTEVSFVGSSDNSLENYAPIVIPKKKNASKTKPLSASKTKPLNALNTKSLNVSIKKPVLNEKSSDSKKLKKKKATLETDILKEVLTNKMDQAVKRGKAVDAKDRIGNNKNPNIPSGDQQVSAFAVYNLERKKKRKLSKIEDVPLQSKKLKSSGDEGEEVKDAKSKKIEKGKKKKESTESGTGSPQPKDWQVTDATPKKKLKILSDIPFGFQEDPATPKRVNGFEVTCATPKQVGWKVRSILSAGQKDVPEPSKKRAKSSARSDHSSLPSPKKVWTSIGYFEVSEPDNPVWSRNQYRPESLGAKTDFVVHSLGSKKQKVSESTECYSSTALDFKRRANFNDKIKRESSKELLQKKVKKRF